MQPACAAGRVGNRLRSLAKMMGQTAELERMRADQLKIDNLIKQIVTILGNKVRLIATNASVWFPQSWCCNKHN